MNLSSSVRLLLLLACLSGLSAASAGSPHRIATGAGSKLDVVVTECFMGLVQHGYFPLKVEITNGSNSEKTWTISAKYDDYGYYGGSFDVEWQQDLTVPAGEKRSFEVLCPVIKTRPYGSGYQVSVQGPSTAGEFWISNSGYTSYSNPIYGLCSDSLRLRYSGRIRNYLENNNTNLLSDDTEIGFLLRDWRGYSGVDMLWFQQSDWEKLRPDEQRPILEWVAQGGDLRILKDKGTPTTQAVSGLPGSGSGLIAHGAGVVRVYPYLSDEELFQYNTSQISSTLEMNDKQSYSDKVIEVYDELGANFWMKSARKRGTLTESFLTAVSEPGSTKATPVDVSFYYEPKGINFPVVLITMLAFGIIVGPVNLWVFSRGRKRYRLLFTTPLIALVFSGAIYIFIVFADGVGGEGQITRLFILPDGSNQEVLIESQYALTGVLPARTFTPGDIWAVPLGSRVSGWASLEIEGTYGIHDGTYWGGWFGSRRVQGLSMTSVRPTRSGFEIQSRDDGLYVVSSFPGFCPDLYLLGADGKSFYRAEGVATGNPTRLKPVKKEQAKEFISRVIGHFDDETRTKVHRMNVQPGHIYASMERYTGDTPQTVGSIDWHEYQSFVIAPAKSLPAQRKEGER